MAISEFRGNITGRKVLLTLCREQRMTIMLHCLCFYMVYCSNIGYLKEVVVLYMQLQHVRDEIEYVLLS